MKTRHDEGQVDKELVTGEEKKISRRSFIKKAVAATIGAGAVLAGGYSFLLEPYNVVFERHEIRLPGLSQKWAGKKIVQVTDIHSSRIISKDYIKKAFDGINNEEPDIIVFTGDYVTRKKEFADVLAGEAKKLKTKIKDNGKIAVVGNHDWWTGEKHVMGCLADSGFTILKNENVTLTTGGDPLHVAGVDDLWSGNADIEKALGKIDPKVDPLIMLSHNPDLFYMCSTFKVPITLSGHTHGGQVVVPFYGPPILPTRTGYAAGFYELGESKLYVNRGLGMIAPPVRFLCPPEVTVFTLQAG